MLESALDWHILQSYGTYALALAASFYASMRFFGGHLNKAAKENLALWLLGAYESTWSSHFCRLFDRVFGDKHLSLRCFSRSAFASIITVVLLWILLGPILGQLDRRTTGTLDIWQAILLGGAINVLPDYVSLLETRWLLQNFRAVRTIRGQVLVLVADMLFTAAIIWLAITCFIEVRGGDPLSVVEMLGLFSIYSIFYYSTFLTSAWAWLYCLSTWFMRLFSHSFLIRLLDVEEKPTDQIALVGAILLLIFTAAFLPVLYSADADSTSLVDRKLCEWFADDACPHVIRMSEDEKLSLTYFAQLCEVTPISKCLEKIDRYSGGIDEKSSELFQKACGLGHSEACINLGWMFAQGRGMAKDEVRAVALYRQACDAGHARGCTNLGLMFTQGRGVAKDEARAVALYRQACDAGHIVGCTNLGWMFAQGRGVAKDEARAVALYRQACDAGHARGCNDLGLMFAQGRGVPKDEVRAREFYWQTCFSPPGSARGLIVGDARGCNDLGLMIAQGRGGAKNEIFARLLYSLACDAGYARGCANFGSIISVQGLGADDETRATEFYRQACDAGDALGCKLLNDIPP